MASVQQHQEPSAPVPFFTDTRTLSQKLVADNQEWRPSQPEYDCPSMIFGLVLELGTYTSDYKKDGAPKIHTSARILTDDNIIWSVIAFHGYLQSEFDRKRPREGDFVAIAYLGTKPSRKAGENDANVYQMEVERNPATPLALAAPEPAGEPATAVSDPPEDDEADTAAAATDDIPF